VVVVGVVVVGVVVASLVVMPGDLGMDVVVRWWLHNSHEHEPVPVHVVVDVVTTLTLVLSHCCTAASSPRGGSKFMEDLGEDGFREMVFVLNSMGCIPCVCLENTILL
jgi:hypothetical protein